MLFLELQELSEGWVWINGSHYSLVTMNDHSFPMYDICENWVLVGKDSYHLNHQCPQEDLTLAINDPYMVLLARTTMTVEWDPPEL